MDLSAYLTGLMSGLALIVAIGAQNAFVLRQGLRGEHVLAVVLACAVSDAILIIIGVAGFRQMTILLPWLEPAMRFGGAAFLVLYGARSFYRTFRSSAVLEADRRVGTSLRRTLATCLALTWLNPHVYLDTVVLLGTISTQFPGSGTAFAAGAVSGSFLFFFSLGYGAAWLRPVFATSASWRILEALVGIVMWAIAYRLLSGV